ncbi:DUF4132 domain-containing protein [Streptacidiphilus sp. PB12-B1b]|uniref:DUF4132 domain-containing protein n=1 Tax=Streptacidiphilus sp. PB12-B1b TaxID=2705012 RepID=UPI0015F8E387|nr:DUF4132 domain-containing protein [Streptacidiphilus sp. PB12-B1b]QMU77898.1 DUF4132 domain-containing protein [Streptacidiphilus sp. PB12-B1b]
MQQQEFDSGTGPGLPDETVFVLPQGWRRALHPRRGGTPQALPAPVADAEALVAGALRQEADWLDRMLGSPDSDPRIVAAMREHLGGRPSPLGAAALAVVGNSHRLPGGAFTDAWTAAHGLPFAACAAAALFEIEPFWNQQSPPALRFAAEPGTVDAHQLRPQADRARALLAAADEPGYRAAVTALAGCRTGSRSRVVVSYLVPGEADWVEECCADPAVTAAADPALRALLLCSLSSAEQLAALGSGARMGWNGWPLSLVATVAEGLGTAAVPLLAEAFAEAGNPAQLGALAAALAEFPTDEAFALLLSRMASKPVRPELATAMRRYPVRALRLMGAAALGPGPQAAAVRRLLAPRVRAQRGRCLAALPQLDREVAALVVSLAGPGPQLPDAPSSALPRLLVEPPWVGRRARAGAGADPLLGALPARMPELPEWAEPALLPQIVLAGGGAALPESAVRQVLTVLALSGPGRVYPGLAEITAACTAESLAEFAWALFEEWRLASMPAKDSWPLYALGELGDDGTVRRFAPVLWAWPGEGAHRRAVEGLEVLARIGSEVALLHLHGIAQRVRFKALKARAQEKIAEVAAGLGLTAEQLADRLVPDLGLEPDGSTVVDYGPRRFTVGFDEQLRPFVRDADGGRRKELPAPGPGDDPELAPAGRRRFAALRKDVRTVAAEQVWRLEAAMVSRREWTAGEFREFLVGHPLVGQLVRRLVWLAEADGTATAFRVTGGGGFADAADREVPLPAKAGVRAAHPLELAGEVPAWSALFAGQGIVQPFPQLARPVRALTPTEAGADRLLRFEGRTVPVGRLLGLTRRGWERGQPQDAGVERWISKRLGESRYLVVALDEGIVAGAAGEFPDQRLESVRLACRPQDRQAHDGRPLRFGGLDPVTASELLVDLEQLTAV